MSDSREKIPELYPVQKATPEDAEQIQQVIQDSWITTMSEALRVPPERLEEVFEGEMSEKRLAEKREQLAHPPEGCTTLVAKDGRNVLGVIIVQQRANADGENELAVMHMRPGNQGVGIGRSLWNMAKKSLDPTKDTFLWTTPGTVAVDVYKRFDFQETEYTTQILNTKEPLSRPRVKMVRRAEGIR